MAAHYCKMGQALECDKQRAGTPIGSKMVCPRSACRALQNTGFNKCVAVVYHRLASAHKREFGGWHILWAAITCGSGPLFFVPPR